MAAPAAPNGPWSDYESLKHGIKSFTVDKLKQLIVGLCEECSVNIAKTGKKQDLIDRVSNLLTRYYDAQDLTNWNKARGVIYQVRTSGHYSSNPTAFAGPSSLNQRTGALPAGANGYSLGSASASSSPYGSNLARRGLPGRPNSPVNKQGPTSSLRFKPSPFFRIDQAVSSVVECPESTGSTDRRSQHLVFTLTQDQHSKLTQNGSKYELRLFCTSSTYHSPSPSAFRPLAGQCLIEFPATCEVRVNNVPLNANLKGVKKKPGTAPPADLGRSVRLTVGSSNRVEMVYVNGVQGVGPKKFYLVVNLVEKTTVDDLVDKLRKGKYKSADDVRDQMRKSASDDDEVVAGKLKMSLKCPLSYIRIKTPCRSQKCVHPQCFDATSWYSMMEQTTTWLCPVCEKVLNVDELIVDGLFDDILQKCPDSVEEVEVEPDGEWHTEDNTYSSPAWRSSHVSKPTSSSSHSANGSLHAKPSGPAAPSAASTSYRAVSNDDVVVLDSDEEYEDTYAHEVASSQSERPSEQKERSGAIVIDLTLDSDDEGTPPPSNGKRRMSSSSGPSREPFPKKQRSEDIPLMLSLPRPTPQPQPAPYSSSLMQPIVLPPPTSSAIRPYQSSSGSGDPDPRAGQYSSSTYSYTSNGAQITSIHSIGSSSRPGVPQAPRDGTSNGYHMSVAYIPRKENTSW